VHKSVAPYGFPDGLGHSEFDGVGAGSEGVFFRWFAKGLQGGVCRSPCRPGPPLFPFPLKTLGSRSASRYDGAATKDWELGGFSHYPHAPSESDHRTKPHSNGTDD
jgi:hypothetical protein